ncbi:hypothetical protein EDD84_22235 [Burkholderia gladioli]|nr:hypothetical protein [Burkholderia gladioli]AYQ90138.1 hypothetical protein EDD84_22235 [Burkholderia gladioli]
MHAFLDRHQGDQHIDDAAAAQVEDRVADMADGFAVRAARERAVEQVGKRRGAARVAGIGIAQGIGGGGRHRGLPVGEWERRARCAQRGCDT